MHAGVWDGVDYDGGASCEMRQNPRCFSVCLWPQPVAVYILGPEAVLCRDHNPKPTRFLIRILTGQEIKKLVACTPRPGEASERARVVFPFSSHTPLRVVERTHYIKRSNSSSTSKVGLNLAPPLAILHMAFEISKIAMRLAH